MIKENQDSQDKGPRKDFRGHITHEAIMYNLAIRVEGDPDKPGTMVRGKLSVVPRVGEILRVQEVQKAFRINEVIYNVMGGGGGDEVEITMVELVVSAIEVPSFQYGDFKNLRDADVTLSEF